MANVSPIADLTYRNYDGPLDAPHNRWWVIAKAGIRKAVKNKWYWVALVGSGMYYVVMMIVLFIVDQLKANAGPQGEVPFMTFLKGIKWTDQFLHGFSYGQMWYLIIALMVGAGAIANDNRANALLVYLSKPCTKTDYLIGKWVGVFIPLLAAMLLPALFFFAFGAMSYREYGFLSSDPWLILKILALMPLGAAVETSLILGVSSLFRQGQIAGASYGGLYFITNFFTVMIGVAYAMSFMDRGASPKGPIWNLYYASIDGLQIALAKGVLVTNGGQPFGIVPRGNNPDPVPMPNLPITMAVALGLCALVLWFAWTRIKAVEVVR
jgi:ABC-2 type transport system permease protein